MRILIGSKLYTIFPEMIYKKSKVPRKSGKPKALIEKRKDEKFQ